MHGGAATGDAYGAAMCRLSSSLQKGTCGRHLCQIRGQNAIHPRAAHSQTSRPMAFDGDAGETFSDGLSDVFGMDASSVRSGRSSFGFRRNQSASSLSAHGTSLSQVPTMAPLGGPVSFGAISLALRDVLDSVSRGEFQDAAKSLLDMEGKGQRPESPVLDAFNRLFLQTEKAYLSMAYVAKHSPAELAAKYDTFSERLKIVKDSIHHSASDLTREEVRSFWVDAAHLASARRTTIHAYHEIFGSGESMVHPNRLEEVAGQLRKVESDLSKIISASTEARPTSIFTSIFVNAANECTVLLCLLLGHIAVINIQFKETMVQLYKCKKLLETWEACFSRSAEDARSLTTTQMPHVCHVLKAVYKQLVAKSSIYFQGMVGKGAAIELPPKFKIVSASKRGRDFYLQWVHHFLRSTRALFVGTILNTQGSTQHFNEYKHPATPFDAPSGLRSFPVIFSSPMEPQPYNRTHVIAIVSVITDNEVALSSRKVIFFDEGEFRPKAEKDKEKNVYFVAQVDDRTFMVVVFHLKGKKLEKDVDTQSRRFLEDLSRELRVWSPDV